MSEPPLDERSFAFKDLAVTTTDHECDVRGWTRSPEELPGRTARESRAAPTGELLAGSPQQVLAPPARTVAVQERGVALLHALSDQVHVGFALHGMDLNVVRTNGTAGLFGGPPVLVGAVNGDVPAAIDVQDIESALRKVLQHGRSGGSDRRVAPVE
ncbi:hypothetical protein [Streptomyces sp. NPDC091217]|uniref:hypothetical protein n=1 Tax=Streptomyces sp. NPDC091217 TaxID=3365975 RepID=UPI003827B4DF